MIRLFLDANVLFTAAHNPSGKAALITDLGSRRYWEVVTFSYAIAEARHNISLKFPDHLKRFEALLTHVTKTSCSSGHMCPGQLPEKDRPILEAAILCKATHLLTGDIKDFGSYMNKANLTGGVLIQTVSDFLDGLMKPERRNALKRKK